MDEVCLLHRHIGLIACLDAVPGVNDATRGQHDDASGLRNLRAGEFVQ